jgi:hypothetical protein
MIEGTTVAEATTDSWLFSVAVATNPRARTSANPTDLLRVKLLTRISFAAEM